MIVKAMKKITFAQKTAQAAILLLLTVIGFAMICFRCGLPLGWYSAAVPSGGLLLYSVWRDRPLLKALVLDIALLCVWALICGLIFDWSYDGMYYHKQAIITLKEGWNPLYCGSAEVDVFATYPDMALWLDNYPKGIWIFSAVIYSVTHFLETAKAVNLLFLIPVFCYAYHVLTQVWHFKNGKSIWLSLLFVMNPVFLCQLFTSYNDLAVGALIITTGLICIKIYSQTADNTDYFCLFGCFVLACVVKFTAPILTGLTAAAFGAVCLYRWRDKRIVKPAVVVLAGCLAGICLFGYDPYIKHIFEGKHIIFPVMGEGGYDIMNTNPPIGFADKNGIQKLFLSLFSETNNLIEKGFTLKIPFSIHAREWIHLSNADIRVGGFGLFFSGILFISLLLFFVMLLQKKKLPVGMGVLLSVFTLLTLFFPESWWARYTSYTYYIPLCIVTAYSADTRQRWIPAIAAAVIFINSVIFAVCVVSEGVSVTHMLQTKLQEIKAENKKVILRVNDFPSHVKLFSEYGIDFEVSHQALDTPIIFYRNTKYQYVD